MGDEAANGTEGKMGSGMKSGTESGGAEGRTEDGMKNGTGSEMGNGARDGTGSEREGGERRKLLEKRDVGLVAVLLLASFALWLGYRLLHAGGEPMAEICYRSERIAMIPLGKGEDKRFSLWPDDKVVFHLYEDGSICFESSDCPDKICVHAGRLRHPGESAACLPNEMTLRIVSGESGEKGVDLVP